MKKWLIACLAILGAIGYAGEGKLWAQSATKAAPKAPAPAKKKTTPKTPAQAPAQPEVEVEPQAGGDAPAPSVPPTPTEEDHGPIADPNVPDNLIARRPRDEGPRAPA